MDIGAYIGAKIDEAVDAYDSSTESVKENIETIDDALAVSEERQKWKQAIEKIGADLETNTEKWWYGTNNDCFIKLSDVLEIIDKHTKELMQ